MENLKSKASVKIDIFEPISFCNGVKNSIETVYKIKKEYPNKQIVLLGQLVHNSFVIEQLKKDGIKCIDVLPSDYENAINSLNENFIVVFSAHGHDASLEKVCQEKNITYFDTICPIVKNIHTQIKELIKDENNRIILIGKKNHAETEAILKISEKVVFYDKISSFLVDNQYIYHVFNQTTMLNNKINPIINELKKLNLNIVIHNTTCNFVANRFNKLKNINRENYDCIITIGSKESSNSVELFKASLLQNSNSFLISSVEEAIELKKKFNFQTYAVFSGTSSPIELINSIVSILNN